MEADPQHPVDFEHIIRYFDRAVPMEQSVEGHSL